MNISESIKERLLQKVHDDQYIKMIGMEFTELGRGYAKSRMKVSPGICNPYNSVHGGCLFSLADITSGYAACTYGNYASTISGNMNYIRPAMDTAYIYCNATVIRQGKQVSVYNVELFNDNGDLLENGTFTFYTLNTKVC